MLNNIEALTNKFFPDVEKNTAGEFSEIQIDYGAEFPQEEEQLIKLAQRVLAEKEIVADVMINIPTVLTGLEPSPLADAYVLLGKRAPEPVDVFSGTWAPVFGHAEPYDIELAINSSRVRKSTGGKYTFGEFIMWVASRERFEEVIDLPCQTDIFFGQASNHLDVDRTIHIVAELVLASSWADIPGGKNWQFQTGRGKRYLMSGAKPNSNEHTEFRWFRLGELPPEMHPWSKRAVFLAIKAVMEKERYLITKADGDTAKAAPARTDFILGKETTGDETVDFALDSFPYIYSAFFEWRREVGKSANDEVRKWVSPAENEGIATIDQLARAYVVNGYGLFDYKEIFLYFPVQISDYKIPQTQPELEEAIDAWWSLMSRKSWKKIDDRFPRIAKILESGFSFLPKKMELGDTPFVRTFDRFLLPDIKDSSWVVAFHDWIANDYEQIVDSRLKEAVFKELFSGLGNESQSLVLDVGTGTGMASKFKPEKTRLIGVDLSWNMCQLARRRINEVFQMDAAKLYFKDNVVDKTILSFVDFWLEPGRREQILREALRVIKPGGQLVMNVHKPDPDWENYYQNLLSKIGFFKTECYKKSALRKEGGEYTIYIVRGTKGR